MTLHCLSIRLSYEPEPGVLGRDSPPQFRSVHDVQKACSKSVFRSETGEPDRATRNPARKDHLGYKMAARGPHGLGGKGPADSARFGPVQSGQKHSAQHEGGKGSQTGPKQRAAAGTGTRLLLLRCHRVTVRLTVQANGRQPC